MPLQKLQFRPGVNREGTTLANEGGWFECDKIRFRSGFPEKLGGWVLDTGTYYPTAPIDTLVEDGTETSAVPPAGSYWGVCRSMWNWNSLAGNNYLGLGTNLKFYIQNGPNGYFYDVTPIRETNVVASNAFTTVNASTSVKVNDPGHGAQTGDFVMISGVSGAVNGIPDTALNREFQITYINGNQYSITVGSPATSSGTTGAATLTYQITTGLETYTVATGWGAGNWGGTTSGSTTTTLATALVGTTLTAFITSTATTINVASTTGFASPSGSLWIGNELITYTGTTSTSFTGCTRGTSGTTAYPYTASTAVAADTTSIVLTSGTGFPASNGTIVIDSESITYSTKTVNTLSGCVRGANGTRAAAHSAGATVTEVITSGTTSWTGWGAAAAQGVGIQLRLWSQSNYGEDLIFNPRGGALYYWSVNVNPNVFDRGVLMKAGDTVNGAVMDSTTPSVSNIVMVSDSSRFVICFGTNDPSETLFPELNGEQDPLLIRWSQQEEFNTWTPSPTNQAGDYRLSRGSEIVATQQTRQEILVWTDAALYSMQYLGPPYVWGFQIMGDNLSIAGPNVVSVANNVTYWMGTDKFYMYSGRVETLPCTLRQYVYQDINMLQSYQFFSSTNEGYNEIWWFYCSANSNTIDKYVVFNHLERTWYYGTMARTAWIDSPLRTVPMAAGYAGQSCGNLIYHETGNDDGATVPGSLTPIISYVQSSDFDIGDGHNFGIVWRIIPDVTFDGSNVANPSLDFTVRPRQNPGTNYGTSDSPSVVSAQTYSPTARTQTVQQFTEYAYVRIRGRQMAFKVSSGTQGSSTDGLGVAWQLGTPRLDVRPDGRR